MQIFESHMLADQFQESRCHGHVVNSDLGRFGPSQFGPQIFRR